MKNRQKWKRKKIYIKKNEKVKENKMDEKKAKNRKTRGEKRSRKFFFQEQGKINQETFKRGILEGLTGSNSNNVFFK